MIKDRKEQEIIDIPIMISYSATDFGEIKVNDSVVSTIPISQIADMLLHGFNLSHVDAPAGS